MRPLHFGAFELNAGTGELRRGRRVVHLGPQALKVLALLATRAGEIVTREEIERELWADGTSVDYEHGVNTCVSQIRRALGDRASRPRFVETVPRRGYRFRARVSRGPQPAASGTRPLLIGRADALAVLHDVYIRIAGTRHGRIVCVSGEPGIGKTTLARSFVADLRDTGEPKPLLARGRCSERLAGTEAYLPWLEAIEDLIEDDRTGEAARLLRAVAPTWRAWVAPTPLDAGVSNGLASPQSQEQLKRELIAWLRRVSERQPVLIWFEDLHWADTSTVDLIAYVAGRLDDLPLLFVITHRETELLLSNHPFATTRLELRAHGLCLDLPLTLWTPDDVRNYLDAEFPKHEFPVALAALVHERTEGSPLFVVDSAEYLRTTGAIVPSTDGWTLAGALPRLERELPQSVTSMIERKLGLLDDDDVELLRLASVQGYDFDSATVADVAGIEPSLVEMRLQALGRIHTVVRPIGERRPASGSVTLAYRFVHVLYQNALYAQLTPSRRAPLSLSVATALLARQDANEIAPLLARLFEAGGDARRACDFALIAAQQAASRFANHEVAVLAQRALDLLSQIDDADERDRRELDLRMTLGPALTALQGWAADAVGANFARAQALCEQRTDLSALLGPLFGFSLFHIVRANLAEALRLSERLTQLVEPLDDPLPRLRAVGDRGLCLFQMGRAREGRRFLVRCLEMYEPGHHDRLVSQFGLDTVAVAASILAYSELLEGNLDRARAGLELAWEYARSHPFTCAVVGAYEMLVPFTLGDAEETRTRADHVVSLSEEHGFAGQAAFGSFFRGWAIAMNGDYESGVAAMDEAERRLCAVGNDVYLSARLLGVADAHRRHGRTGLALIALDAADAFLVRSGERLQEPELHRLRGLLALDAGDEDLAGRAFERALASARTLGAPFFELRAATALARCRGGDAKARHALERIYAGFTEGLDHPDLIQARETLDGSATEA